MSHPLSLVRYGCGCIGFRIPEGSNSNDALIIKDCIEEEICFGKVGILPINLKTTPLSDEENESFVQEINSLIRDGDKFRQLKGLLR
jgi:hypothetical protein